MEKEKNVWKVAKLYGKRGLLVLGLLICLGILTGIILNSYLILYSSRYILNQDQVQKLEDVDCIMVLGAGVKPDKSPTLMLEERLSTGILLYEEGVSDRLLMSGDHGTKYYDEVNCMKGYAIDQGITSSDIFMDHAGFCTYDSMYRAKNIFKVEKMVVVTQGYHMFRAIYDARKQGIEAYGIVCQKTHYNGQLYREAREVLARVKDWGVCILNPGSKILGDPISLDLSGDVTNDK